MSPVEVPTELNLRGMLRPGFTARDLMASKESHIVFLTGAIKATSPSPGDVVMTIPDGWRVKVAQTVPVFDVDGLRWATLDCAPDGKVTWRQGAAGTYLVSGTSYVDPWRNG